MGYKFYISAVFWLILALISLGIGQYGVGVFEILHILLGKITNEVSKDVILNIRLPRVLGSSLCGGILAICGMSLQGLFKNPLVDPKIIGVSTGAAFGGCLAILLGVGGFWLVIFAFIFGLISLLMLYFIASFVKTINIFTLILSGIVVNGFFAALISLIQYVADTEEVLPNIIFWLLGSFVNVGYEKLLLLIIIALPCVLILFFMRWRFNLLSLDEKDLRALGVSLNSLRAIILLVCTLMIATQVSVSGNIGWIGLVVPHMARMISGADHVKSLPLSFIFGAIFMLLIDNLARSITMGEIPLGILSALIGTPVFAYLLKRSSKNVT